MSKPDWADMIAKGLCYDDVGPYVSETEVALALREAMKLGENRIMSLMAKHINECGCHEAFHGYCPELVKAIYNRNKAPTP